MPAIIDDLQYDFLSRDQRGFFGLQDMIDRGDADIRRDHFPRDAFAVEADDISTLFASCRRAFSVVHVLLLPKPPEFCVRRGGSPFVLIVMVA